MDTRVAVIGSLKFPKERIAEVLPHLKTFVEATREKDGCIFFDVAEDAFEPGLIRVSELWPDKESLERHLKAPHVDPWRAAARACGIGERKFTAYAIGHSWAM